MPDTPRHNLDFDEEDFPVSSSGVPEKYGEEDDASKLEWIAELQAGRDEVRGCTSPNATNYNPAATKDDGSCIFPTLENLEAGAEIGGNGVFHPSVASPLPSLPSISNVGSVPFTGTVSTIPGGFQPLPQVAGQRKKLYQLSKFHGGINSKSSPRDISDTECQKANNVTVSQVGRITLLGDCLNENNALKEFAAITAADLPGYGLFEFTAPIDPSGSVAGDQVILLTADGDQVDSLCDNNNDGNDDTIAGWIDMAGTDDGTIAQVYYAAGNGVYVGDASFTNPSKAKIYVYRVDAGSSQTVSGWKEGKPLIDSPTYDDAAAGSLAAGDVKVKQAAETASVDGSMIVECTPTGTGLWNGDYYFYVSWLFDGGVETGLTSAGDDDGDDSNSDGITFSNNTLEFNINLMHDPHASANTELGGDKRIEGGRIYFKKVGDSERFLLGEFNLIDGVKGALDSTFSPWTESSNNYSLGSDIVFEAPPEVYSYASLNGYYANEVYGESPDINADNATGPTAKDVRYKTAVVGSGGIVFIGNVRFDSKHMPDSMMFSMPGKPGVFPMYNRFDSPSSDGSPITALAAYRDTILQFKQNGMYVINVSNPAQFYAQASFRDCGVFNPCQVFTTSFGVIFANKNGCYIYDGQKVTSLTDGKFDWITQSYIGGSSPATEETSNTTTANFPCVGYDPRSQSIIVLKDIGDDTDATASIGEGALIYNMPTQSWTTASDFINNGDGTRHSNFIITNEGYLSIKSSGDATLLNYNHDKGVDTGDQTITYWTKDFDFGLPSQTKKIFKVYVTYKGDADSLAVKYAVDGESHDSDVTYTFHDTSSDGSSSGSSDGNATPLLDKDSTEDIEDWHVAELVPTTASEATGIYSISLFFQGAVSDDFEINDISILYRVRPIK